MTRTASFIIGSILAASALTLTACGGDAATEAAGPKAPAVIEIGRENVVEVTSQKITVGPLVSGELKAEREATVRAEIGGAVLQVYPREGETVGIVDVSEGSSEERIVGLMLGERAKDLGVVRADRVSAREAAAVPRVAARGLRAGSRL